MSFTQDWLLKCSQIFETYDNCVSEGVSIFLHTVDCLEPGRLCLSSQWQHSGSALLSALQSQPLTENSKNSKPRSCSLCAVSVSVSYNVHGDPNNGGDFIIPIYLVSQLRHGKLGNLSKSQCRPYWVSCLCQAQVPQITMPKHCAKMHLTGFNLKPDSNSEISVCLFFSWGNQNS